VALEEGGGEANEATYIPILEVPRGGRLGDGSEVEAIRCCYLRRHRSSVTPCRPAQTRPQTTVSDIPAFAEYGNCPPPQGL